MWEPSPFPVELPAGRRRAIAEPAFATAPWPERPAWLWPQPTRKPGDVRYAKDWFRRGAEMALLVALSREQAEERHNAPETYVLMVRLPNRALLTMRHRAAQDRLDPGRRQHASSLVSYKMIIDTSSMRIVADATTGVRRPGAVEIVSIEVRKRRSTRRLWSIHLDAQKREKSIQDRRGRRMTPSEAPLTAAEHKLCVFSKPRFGEYSTFLDRVRSLLHTHGLTV